MIQNIKQLCISSFLALGSISFSFYKMEKIYCDSSLININSKVFRFSDCEKMNQSKKRYFFLYDKNTFTQMFFEIENRDLCGKNSKFLMESYSQPSQLQSQALKFLNCDFEYNQGLFIENDKYTSYGYYRKQKLVFNQDRSIKKGLVSSNDKEYRLFEYSNKGLKGLFSINTELESLSKVEIKNTENGVLLNRDNKIVNITDALKKYFVRSLDQLDPEEFSDRLAAYYKCSSYHSEVHPEKELEEIINLRNYERKSLNKEDYDRLQNSTILAIWTLIPKEKEIVKEGVKIIETKESEMIGLARDERTKELYHWTTDLGQDISVLMNYNPKN